MSAFWKERDRMFLSSSFCRPPSQAPTAAQLLGLRQCSVHTAIAGTIWLSLSPLCQSGTKEKSWAEKNLRGKSEEVCVVKKRNVNPVCLKSHLALPRACVNHPVLIFLEVCHTLTWACLYSLIPSCAPPPFLSLLMFFVTLKTVLWTRNFRHINLVFCMPWGMRSGFSKVFFLMSSFQILVPFDYSKINTWRSWKEPQG